MRQSKLGVTIEVKVQPRSSRKGIDSIEGDLLKVKLTAPPEGGKANEQLVEVLSKALGVPRARISIIKGASSRNKVVRIEGVSPEDIETRIRQ